MVYAACRDCNGTTIPGCTRCFTCLKAELKRRDREWVNEMKRRGLVSTEVAFAHYATALETPARSEP